MRAGEHVRTPRFCMVTIQEVFPTEKEMEEAGYTEPTYIKNEQYEVRAKSLDAHHMKFAAAVRDSVIRQLMNLAKDEKEEKDFSEMLHGEEYSITEALHNSLYHHAGEFKGSFTDQDGYRHSVFLMDEMPGWAISFRDKDGVWRFGQLLPEEEVLKSFVVSFHFEGVRSIPVTAVSLDEAVKKAEAISVDIDCGELTDIEWTQCGEEEEPEEVLKERLKEERNARYPSKEVWRVTSTESTYAEDFFTCFDEAKRFTIKLDEMYGQGDTELLFDGHPGEREKRFPDDLVFKDWGTDDDYSYIRLTHIPSFSSEAEELIWKAKDECRTAQIGMTHYMMTLEDTCTVENPIENLQGIVGRLSELI